MAFVTLSKNQFETALAEVGNFREAVVPGCNERVYDVSTQNPNVAVRIYSTVDKTTGTTRAKGQDAIRIVFWDQQNDRPVGSAKKVLRVEKQTGIMERIKQRVYEFMSESQTVSILDFNYVRAILEENTWSDFANSMLDQLNQRGSLSDKQLSYVIGERAPNGKPTMEARLLQDRPDFRETYLNRQAETEAEAPPIIDIPPNPYNLTTVEAEFDRAMREQGKHERAVKQVPNPGTHPSTGEKPRSPEIQPLNTDFSVISDAPKLVKTASYPGWAYPFTHFNPVQSQVVPLQTEDKNMVIGANTSAGKTICAELLMDHTLKQERLNRVIYLSPLKSLTQEKYADWQKRFPNQEITILTGDYTLSEEMKQKLAKSRIIVMTSEMADSRTRRMHTEKNFWLMEVGLVIVDESHILSTDRGHAVEAGIMRFTKLNPKARVLFLSATMPNVGELADWLTQLNGKQTSIIFSTWRPVTLQMHFEEYHPVMGNYGRENYWATQDRKRNKAVEIAMSKRNEKFLIFCHDKATGRDVVKRLEQEGEAAVFHNADLDLEERLEIENSFSKRDGGLRVLVSTSTLAWGRNLPARNVIITGVHRGLQTVDQLDIIQMAGRSGRYGIDDEGHVYLIIPFGTTESWMETFANPRPVTSVLNQRHILAFHVLAEIMNREIKGVRDLFNWYSRSLAGMQKKTPFEQEDATALLVELHNMEMVSFRDRENLVLPSITDLGKVSAWLYYSPYDVYSWYRNFKKLEEKNLFADDLALAWAVADVPSNDPGFISRDVAADADQLKWNLRNRGIEASDAMVAVIAANDALMGRAQKESEGAVRAARRTLAMDVRRMLQAWELIDSMYAHYQKPATDSWKELGLRLQYGVSREAAKFVKIPGVGGVKANKIIQQGISSIPELVSPEGRVKLRRVFKPLEVGRIVKEAQKLMEAAQ